MFKKKSEDNPLMYKNFHMQTYKEVPINQFVETIVQENNGFHIPSLNAFIAEWHMTTYCFKSSMVVVPYFPNKINGLQAIYLI